MLLIKKFSFRKVRECLHKIPYLLHALKVEIKCLYYNAIVNFA